MRSLPLLAVGLLLAGCVTPPTDVEPSAADDAAASSAAYASLQAALGDLPCEASSVGAETSDNLRDVAFLPYETFTEPTAHGEIDLRGDWMLVARYGGGGFEIVNVADPAVPTQVALHAVDGPGALDVKWMPDGKSAVVGRDTMIELVDLTEIVDSTLPLAELAAANLTPTLVYTWQHPMPTVPMPVTNMHMLYTKRIAESDYVFIAPNDDTGVWILKLTGVGAERKLEYVTNVAIPLGGGVIGPHDMWVGDDEILGTPVLWVSNGFEGFKAYDVGDPANPELLSIFPNFVGQGYTHSIMAQKVGDRRLMATIAEVGVNTLRVWDVTNLAAPILLAEWWADRADPSQAQHNLQIVNGTLYVAHYGYGVYAFDLNGLTLPLVGSATLAPVAHYATQGSIWDVAIHRGLMYVNDIGAGTGVVAFGCMVPGDELATSTG